MQLNQKPGSENSHEQNMIENSWVMVDHKLNRNATQSGVLSRLTTLNSALRWQGNNSLEVWSDSALNHIQRLFPELKLLQTSLYVLFGEDQNIFLKCAGGLALLADAPTTLRLGEGLVGQAAKNKRSFHFALLDEMNQGINSAFFKIQGRSVHIFPLVYNEHTIGVWELVSTHTTESMPQNTLTKLAAAITNNLAEISNHLRIAALLAESQEKNKTLEQQEWVLKQRLVEINTTQQQLQELQAELEEANDGLEAKVLDRTKELEETLTQLQTAQQQLVMSEKMASLGHLIAGVAHEINTPIGAVKAASTNILDMLPQMLEHSASLIPHLSSIQQAQVAEMIHYFLSHDQLLGSKEERLKKRKFTAELEQVGFPDADVLADSLVSAGFYESPLKYIDLFLSEKRDLILQYVSGQGQIIRNLRNIRLAANKTTKVVFALKNFSHMHDSETSVPVNLKENLETVLILYHNQLKQGITVETEYDEAPSIMGNPDELSQVWTNIIQNAAQAMDYQGKLRVVLHNQGGYALIEITDSGKGIPKEIQERIFEPFFTTKRRGEGTGLGLDICRKIVEKHKGKIYLTSRPGQTSFFVEIPFIPIS